MQVVLVVLVAALAILSQVPCDDDVILTEQEVALKLTTKESYRAVSDFFDYPKVSSGEGRALRNCHVASAEAGVGASRCCQAGGQLVFELDAAEAFISRE